MGYFVQAFLFCLVFDALHAKIGLDFKTFKDTPQHFCGSNLEAAMEVACRGDNTEIKGKRGYDADYDYGDDFDDTLFLKSVLRDLLFKRGSMGIVPECCLRKCTLNYMRRNYCAPEGYYAEVAYH